jgi:hypothetical protein
VVVHGDARGRSGDGGSCSGSVDVVDACGTSRKFRQRACPGQRDQTLTRRRRGVDRANGVVEVARVQAGRGPATARRSGSTRHRSPATGTGRSSGVVVIVEHPPGPFYTSDAAGPCSRRHNSGRHARSVSGQTRSRCPAGRSWSSGDRAGPRPRPRGGSPRRPAACHHRREHGPAGGAGGDAAR